MKRAVLFALSVASAGGSSLLGCGGGQAHLDLFTTNWSDDRGASIEALRQRIGAAPATVGADVAVGVTGRLDGLVGLPLAGGSPWRFAHPLSSRPIVASSVVVGSGGDEVFALDAATGKKLWARPTGGLTLHGAGDDGKVTVVTLGSATGTGSTLLAVTRGGGVVQQMETGQELGAPALLGGYAFVPWSNQYLSVLDLSGGSEVARVVLREKTSRAWTVGGALYFGEFGFFRFDEHIKDASRNQATHLALPSRELPGTPRLLAPGSEPAGPSAGAPDKIRLYARPSAPSGPLALDSDRFYATYFRLVIGFTGGKGALAWVHTHPSDVLGGAAAAGGLVLCDAQGKVTVLGAGHGGVVSEADLGAPLASCVVQADAFAGTSPEQSPGTLAAQLATALVNREAELATAQRLLMRELATMPDEDATKTLVEIASDPRTSPLLIGDARSQLAARRNGARYMLAALERHYDYLKDVLRPPPVGPIAQALAAMDEKGAAPLLASHLFDPADTDDDVKQAATALVTLGTPAEVPALKQFFSMYRDAPDEPAETPDAVVSAGQALVKLGGADGRATVDRALAHLLVNATVKGKLQAILDAEAAQKGAPQR